MDIIKTDKSGRVKIMNNGVKLYVTPYANKVTARVASSGNLDLTEEEAREAYGVAVGLEVKNLRGCRANRKSGLEFIVNED